MDVNEKASIIRDCRLKERIVLYDYVKAVGDIIGRGKALELLQKKNVERELNWIDENLPKLCIEGDNAIAARDLLDRLFSANAPGYVPPERFVNTPERVAIRSSGRCVILEAANAVGLSTKEVCGISYNHIPAVKRINPKLTIKTIKMRPEDNCCESMIVFENTE
jgi:hypothetical protein